MSANIIGVSGFMRTGKDSVAALLQGFGYQRISFADPLRKVAADIDPYIDLTDVPEGLGLASFEKRTYTQLLDELGYEKAKSIPDFRRFLQRLGTEGIRGNFGEDAWVDMAYETIGALPAGSKVVLPDVRFPNEARCIKALGGVVWRTERPGFGGGEHPSEAMVLKITPDVILSADSLLDNGKDGLGSLVLRQLGLDPTDSRNQQTLADWADAILNG